MEEGRYAKLKAEVAQLKKKRKFKKSDYKELTDKIDLIKDQLIIITKTLGCFLDGLNQLMDQITKMEGNKNE